MLLPLGVGLFGRVRTLLFKGKSQLRHRVQWCCRKLRKRLLLVRNLERHLMQSESFHLCSLGCRLHSLFNQHAGGVRVSEVTAAHEGIENFVWSLHFLRRLGTHVPSFLLIYYGFVQVIEVICSFPFSEVIQCKLDKLVDLIVRLELMDTVLELREGIASEFLEVFSPELSEVAALASEIQADVGDLWGRVLAHEVVVLLHGVTEKLCVFVHLH